MGRAFPVGKTSNAAAAAAIPLCYTSASPVFHFYISRFTLLQVTSAPEIKRAWIQGVNYFQCRCCSFHPEPSGGELQLERLRFQPKSSAQF